MPTQLKVTITKDILRRCRNCGNESGQFEVGNNCAIALALIDIFPEVYIGSFYLLPFGKAKGSEQELRIPLPGIAQQFIQLFDGFRLTPNLRLMLPEFEFNLEIPDNVIEQINIDDIRDLLITPKTALTPAL